MNDSAVVATIAAAVAAGTPLALAALGELLTERSGILNLGVEGMMLLGAVVAFVGADGTQSPWVGLALGMLAGGALAAVHAFLSVTMRANQIVSGLALVIFGTGVATFVGQPIEGLPLAARLGNLSIPGLRDVPVLGQVLFSHDVVVYGSWVLAAAIGVYLTRTRAGLSLRAVGESPATADAAGLRVGAIRYTHTIVGGLLAGTGGAYLMLARVPSWSQAATTNGIGWIALALVVFAAWRPWRALAGAYLFGIALRANFALQAAGIGSVPAELLSMLPYLLTIAVLLVLSVGDVRARLGAPAALGTAYVRDER